MRVLVTGGHGFVGSHLVARLLGAGEAVRCLVRHGGVPPALAGLDVEIVQGDARDATAARRAMEGVDEVHHLAALTRSRTRREMFATNVGATRTLLDAACRAGVPGPFVLCSSLAAVGPSPAGGALDEGSPRRPVTWYGESKARAEDVVLARARDLPVLVLRPPAVYGPRDRDFLAVFRAASRGLLPRLGDGPRTYSFIYAADLAAGMVAAARSPAAMGRTFFVTHPTPVEIEDFLLAVARAVGRPARLVRVPDALLRLAAEVAETAGQLSGRPPLLNRQRLRELAGPGYVCSGAALEAAMGWSATTDVAAGTALTAAWYRDQGLLGRRGSR